MLTNTAQSKKENNQSFYDFEELEKSGQRVDKSSVDIKFSCAQKHVNGAKTTLFAFLFQAKQIWYQI